MLCTQVRNIIAIIRSLLPVWIMSIQPNYPVIMTNNRWGNTVVTAANAPPASISSVVVITVAVHV